jgi:hypothetical protein
MASLMSSGVDSLCRLPGQSGCSMEVVSDSRADCCRAALAPPLHNTFCHVGSLAAQSECRYRTCEFTLHLPLSVAWCMLTWS